MLVIGFGKASPAMARAMEDSLGDIIDSGLIVTKYGHGCAGKGGWNMELALAFALEIEGTAGIHCSRPAPTVPTG